MAGAVKRSGVVALVVVGVLLGCGEDRAQQRPADAPGVAVVPTAPAAHCDLYAAPRGSDRAQGDAARPLRTPQALADRLRAGQTGCLRAGRYAAVHGAAGGYVLRVNHGGAPGRRITVRSAPGERATLTGVVYVPRGSNHFRLSDVDIADDNRSDQITVQLDARDTLLERLDITNSSRKTCVILGSMAGYGIAVKAVVRDSVLHDCGDPGNELFDHALYVSNTRQARIVDNVIYGTAAYGVHLYPAARRTLVRGNVIVDNGGGVIFAGEGPHASRGNVVESNVIAGSRRDSNLARYWGGRVGRRNVARDNCLSAGAGGNVDPGPGLRLLRNLTADPGFLDPGRRDYRLTAGSGCGRRLGADLASQALTALAERHARRTAR